MAVDKKLVVVIGATGAQGGGVVTALLKAGQFNVRGVTRDPSSSSAKALAERGVEVVKADLTKPSSLVKAFKGAYGVFIVTDFTSAGAKAAKEVEQGVNAGKAAKEAGVQQVVFSSMDDHAETLKAMNIQLPEAEKGRIIPMHESKSEIAAYLKTLGFPYLTELWTCGFFENYITFTQYPKQEDGTYGLVSNVGHKPLPMHAVGDIGATAAVIFANPEKYNGQAVQVVTEHISADETCAIISEVTGKQVSYHFLPDEKARAMPFPGAKALANMFQYCREADSKARDPSKALVKGQSFREWALDHKEDLLAKLEDKKKPSFLKDLFAGMKIGK